jgi:hypothetical protein
VPNPVQKLHTAASLLSYFTSLGVFLPRCITSYSHVLVRARVFWDRFAFRPSTFRITTRKQHLPLFTLLVAYTTSVIGRSAIPTYREEKTDIAALAGGLRITSRGMRRFSKKGTFPYRLQADDATIRSTCQTTMRASQRLLGMPNASRWEHDTLERSTCCRDSHVASFGPTYKFPMTQDFGTDRAA